MDYRRPPTTDAMQWKAEIEILGLVKRLREYARQPAHCELFCDLDMAANLIDEFLRTSDDFK